MEKHISRATIRTHQRCLQNRSLPIRGYQRAAGIVLLSVLLYQIIAFITIARHAGAENESPPLVDFPCHVIELEI